jgi:HNH endonuclease
MNGTLEERFWAKVEKTETCWLWTASKFSNGYGQFQTPAKNNLAHRLSYELTVGPVPDGLQLDHLCRNVACVRPDHLEPVTCQVNITRGLVPIVSGEHNRVKTHCPDGHPYSGDNLHVNAAGSRVCLTCLRAKRNKWHRDNWPALSERRAARRRA